MWSIGAFLELDDRSKMEAFIRTSEEFSLNLPAIEANSESTMFDYFVDNDGMLHRWTTCLLIGVVIG